MNLMDGSSQNTSGSKNPAVWEGLVRVFFLFHVFFFFFILIFASWAKTGHAWLCLRAGSDYGFWDNYTFLSAQHGRRGAWLWPACQDPSRPCPEVLDGSCEGNKNKPKHSAPLQQPLLLLLVTARRLISPCKHPAWSRPEVPLNSATCARAGQISQGFSVQSLSLGLKCGKTTEK